jgi:Tfp pilus assembly protein FimT
MTVNHYINDCISEVNQVKQDCFPLITNASNDVNNLNNRMCAPEMVNFICCENHWSSKGPVTTTAVNKRSGRIRKAPVTKSNAFCDKTASEAIL